MNDKTLWETLRRLPVPPPDAAARDRARERAEIAFVNRASRSERGRGEAGANPWRLAWSAFSRAEAIGVACLAIVAMVCSAKYLAGRGERGPDSRLLAEMEALFPGQLDGVISSGSSVHLALAPEWVRSGRPSLQPLAVTFQRGRQIVRVLGYSGRKVCVNLGGRERCLEPLVTGEGRVILEGENFLWSTAHPVLVAGYRVEARTL
ncbi:MAG: hypothetical protein PHQ12_00550 [Chthoniobacteraceae bacterium]|nr:hypothetical protein [Chthoniobacteraceae bacterium]